MAGEWDEFKDAHPANVALERLRSRGASITNGFRVDADDERLRRQGNHPAKNSTHKTGDGVDLTPGGEFKTLRQLQAEARKAFGPNAKVEIHSGTHVHAVVPGWGGAPDTTRNNPWDAFDDAPAPVAAAARKAVGFATGEVHDGDTFRLSTGKNARLSGVDAWELGQQGRTSANALMPLGSDARNFLAGRVGPQSPIAPTGLQTYGRPLVNLDDGTANDLLRFGHALATPQYLQGDPRFGPYMDAERQARLNRQGGHATNAETPSQFRHKDGPWKGAEPGKFGEGEAIFGDDPTPFMGLRPEIEQGYLAVWNDPRSKPEDLLAFAKTNGFTIRDEDARRAYAKRFKDGDAPDGPGSLQYVKPPRPITDVGDGTVGAFARGVADPINMLDEYGAVVDALGGTAGRENVFNSDRRFGDILWNNIDQNRSILAHDDQEHPVARIGGQLASAVVTPIGAGIRSVPKLIAYGAGEGFAAGYGAGEGGFTERLPNAALGTAVGMAGAATLGLAGNALAPHLARAAAAFRARFGRAPASAEDAVAVNQIAREMAAEAAPIVNDGVQNAGPTPAARNQPQGGVSAAMEADGGPVLEGPDLRQRDYLNVGPSEDAAGFGVPMGRTPRMGERASPEDIAEAARSIDPEDVVPIPGGNTVETLDEAVKANPGSIRSLEAPDEFAELDVRRIRSRTDFYRGSNVRGPIDITQRLRMMGGIQDKGGDLKHLGIDGTPRRLPFGGGEQFLGKLIKEDGLPLDEATFKLWEEGYFPEFQDRPTPSDLLERLHAENTGAQRYFHPDDLEEVSRFEAAQAERGRIEQAAADGSPLADEIGEPVTLEDLKAMDPPAVAYEDLPKVGGKVANIDLSRVETKDDIARLLKATESRFGGFDAARRGKISNAETEALASELNLRADDLLKRRKGQALNGEQALAARRILAKSAEEVVTLAKKLKGGENGDLQAAAFHMAMVRHAAIQEQVTGATAEAGRALQSFKVVAKAKHHREHVLRAVIEGAGGKHTLEDMAGMILELERDPAKLNSFALASVKPTWKDKAVELWYNSLLSGPQTHAVNILSNSLTAALQLPEHLAAAAIGSGRAAAAKAFGRKEVERVLLSEVGPRTVGMLQGAADGLRAFKYTLKTGEVSDHVTKVESARQEAIGGTAGKIIRVPTRLLSAEDEFFKATARRMELAGLAVRRARSEGLKGEALKSRIAELTANPTDEMVAKSLDYARYLTFQRPLGPAMQNVMAITQRHPWLKLFVPFIRTPTNILKFAVERSPAAPMLSDVRQAMKAGGGQRDLALARIAMGTGLGLLVASWTAGGNVTGGGPADENAKRLLRAQGWQPYSIKIGDKYYSYRRLDPLATTIGVVADMVDLQSAMTERQREDVAPLVIASVLQNLENKTWLSGLSDVLDVIEDPQRNGQRFIERLTGSIAVPAISAQIARTVDPVQRETSSESYIGGATDAIRARVPGLSNDLLPKRDVFGEEIRNEGGVGPNLASPIWTGTAKDEPAAAAALESGASIGPVGRDVGGARLSDEQFNLYQKIAGQLTKIYIQQDMASPEWKGLSGSQRKKRIEAARDDARADARASIGGRPN